MSNREFESDANHNDANLLDSAFMFDGVDFCNGGTKAEVQRARDVLTQQHGNVVPNFTREAIRKIVTQNDFTVQATTQVFYDSLYDNDLVVALGTLNYLHAYGDMDYQDSLGGKAFAHSLGAHRVFAESIFNDFIDYSQTLSPLKKSMLVEIAHYREQKKPAEEPNKLREIIHLTALHGALGEHAKKQFDPFAIPAIKRAIFS